MVSQDKFLSFLTNQLNQKQVINSICTLFGKIAEKKESVVLLERGQ